MNEDKKVRVKLERHEWPDEIENKKHERKHSLNQIFIGILSVIILASFFFIGYSVGKKDGGIQGSSTSNKVDGVISVLENNWYYASSFDDIKSELMDKALHGITSNEVDPHTTYFSKNELEYFTSSLNAEYVGIGVQYVETDDTFIVERVFRNSPAEKSGVQAGDVFYSIDGVLANTLTSDEIRELVRGEQGTLVAIEFLRQGKVIEVEIVRGPVTGTAYGEIKDNEIGYLEISSFGETTANEVKNYLDYFQEKGIKKLIIDLRNNGGGYLDTFLNMAGYFIGNGEAAIQQKFADGKIQTGYARGEKFENIESIVILVNENTASASEVLTIALKETRDDVQVVGTTTYGKGTVQTTLPLSDGSAIKYTTSEWLSPFGTSIQGVGIVPDFEVAEHKVFSFSDELSEKVNYKIDQVGKEVEFMQLCLDYLGYTVKRQDGYFDESSDQALRQFQKDYQMEVDGILVDEVIQQLRAGVVREWRMNNEKDTPYKKALELLQGTNDK